MVLSKVQMILNHVFECLKGEKLLSSAVRVLQVCQQASCQEPSTYQALRMMLLWQASIRGLRTLLTVFESWFSVKVELQLRKRSIKRFLLRWDWSNGLHLPSHDWNLTQDASFAPWCRGTGPVNDSASYSCSGDLDMSLWSSSQESQRTLEPLQCPV